MDFEDIGLISENTKKIREAKNKFADDKAREFAERAKKNKDDVYDPKDPDQEKSIDNLKKRVIIFRKSPFNQNPAGNTNEATVDAYKDLFTKETLSGKSKEIVADDVKAKMAIDPKKQSFDQKFLENRIANELNKDVKDLKGEKANKEVISFQGNKVLTKDGDIKNKSEVEKNGRLAGTKTSDAILHIPNGVNEKGETTYTEVFCTFKSTFSAGGAQDHQRNEAISVARAIKIAENKKTYTIAVLDGDYFYVNNSGGAYTSHFKNALKDNNLGTPRKFTFKGVTFYNIMHAALFVERVGELAKAIEKSSSVITESIITEEEVIEAQKFLNSLNNVEAAMKQQNMNVSKLQRIKQGFLAFMGKLRALGSSIKKGINNIKNRIKGNV